MDNVEYGYWTLTQHTVVVLAGVVGRVVATLQLVVLHVELAKAVTAAAQPAQAEGQA